jgi:hypothetical protein
VAGQTVTWTDNGASVGTATVQSNGSFSGSVTLPSQANNAILASVSDSYGNTNNTYLAATGSGHIAITATQGAGTANDLDFTGGLTDQNLWFLQSGNNLQIDILGSIQHERNREQLVREQREPASGDRCGRIEARQPSVAAGPGDGDLFGEQFGFRSGVTR